MKLSSLKFTLPPQLIAKYPTTHREDARLMVVRRSIGKIDHCTFADIVKYFEKDDTLVLNDIKVFPGRLYGYKEKKKDQDAQIEVLLLRELNAERHLWEVMINPARKIRIGNKLYFGDKSLTAEVIDNTTSRGRTLEFTFEKNSETLYRIFDEIGVSPLPANLKREEDPLDRARYQTVYAKNVRGIVAPDGGLHFTKYILKYLKLKDVQTPAITMHLNYSTLDPLSIQDLARYKLKSSKYTISEQTAKIVNHSLIHKKKVCAVGTPTLKGLEASITNDGLLRPVEKYTNKFVFPPYTPKIANSLLTNFHLPNTISFINTVAFGGRDLIMHVYDVAIKEKYRFFVYGDALLII